MRTPNILLCGIAAIMLTGCTAPLSPEQQAAAQQSAARPIKCREGHDCVDKWHQAIKWVRDNSKTKIDTMSGNLISTTSVASGDWSYTITRTAESKKRYDISIVPACGSVFGCEPSELAVRASFADALLGKVPSKTSSAAAHTYGSIKQLQPQIDAVISKCDAERKKGELKDYRASVECSDPRIIKIFKGASYPYMDMAREFATKRMKLAKQVDSKQITVDEMENKVRDEIASIEKREEQRNSSPPPAAADNTAPAAAAEPMAPPAVSALSAPVVLAPVGTPSSAPVRR
jgi:hypothetical protein